MTGRGLILAAPGSGNGKTTLTLGLLRAFQRRGTPVRGAKSGPDYIDPRFHEAACARPCPNLDAWAMGPDRIAALAAGDGLLLIEGAMGLFDGAPPAGKGQRQTSPAGSACRSCWWSTRATWPRAWRRWWPGSPPMTRRSGLPA